MFQKRNLSVNFYVFVRKFLEVHGPGVHRNLLQTSQTPPGTCVSDIVSIFLQAGKQTVTQRKTPVETGVV
jgi:hypothetical protein